MVSTKRDSYNLYQFQRHVVTSIFPVNIALYATKVKQVMAYLQASALTNNTEITGSNPVRDMRVIAAVGLCCPVYVQNLEWDDTIQTFISLLRKTNTCVINSEL